MPRSANSWAEICRSLWLIWFMVRPFTGAAAARPPPRPPRRLPSFLVNPTTFPSGLFIRPVLDGRAARLCRRLDLDAPHFPLDDAAHQVDVQQPIVERGARHLDAVGQHEGALELARGDAAVEIDAVLVVGLLAAHDELVVLDLDVEIGHREAGDGERDAQGILAGLLDIAGWIAVARRLADAIERSLELIETKKKRRVEEGET